MERFPLWRNLFYDTQQTEQEGINQAAHNLPLVLRIRFNQRLSQQSMIFLESLHTRFIDMNNRTVLQVEGNVYNITGMQHAPGYLTGKTCLLSQSDAADEAEDLESGRKSDG